MASSPATTSKNAYKISCSLPLPKSPRVYIKLPSRLAAVPPRTTAQHCLLPMASSTCPRGAHLAVALLAIALSNAVDAGYRGGGGGGDLKGQFLNQQNGARAAMGLPPLRWDERVASYARWYAESRRGDCALVHSSGPYGENLFWGSGTGGWSPAQAVGAWLAEQPQYNYWSNSCNGRMCGHYTQIVWRQSTRVGCAMVECYNGKGTFITCNYDPPGNYVGMRPY